MFIVLEGLDGCGKTTQAKLLDEWLKKEGYKVLLTAEPTKNEIGKCIRNILSGKKEYTPKTITHLFISDRYEHLEKEIKPALKKKKIVVCERYYHSTIAYQAAQDVDMKRLIELNSFAMEPEVKPDLTIFLDVKPEVVIRKIKEKEANEKAKVEEAERKYEEGKIKLQERMRELRRMRNGIYKNSNRRITDRYEGEVLNKPILRAIVKDIEKAYRSVKSAEKDLENQKKRLERMKSKYIKYKEFERPTTLEANSHDYLDFLKKVYNNYLKFDDFETVDGTQPLEKVSKDIRRLFLKTIKQGSLTQFA